MSLLWPARGLASLLLLVLVVVACRRIAARSPICGVVLYAGLLVRVVAAVALFSISYWDFELLRGLHTGDGFWALAPDARVYYRLATEVTGTGPFAVNSGSPSAFYVNLLGTWLMLTGSHLASAIVFNVLCYVALAVVIAWSSWSRLHEPRAGVVPALALAAFAFSPVLVLTTTQVLKDALFALLATAACVGAMKSLQALRTPEGWLRQFITGSSIFAVCVYGIGGIRPYFGVLLWIAYAIAGIVAWLSAERADRARVIAILPTLVIVWATFATGAGAYYDAYVVMLYNATGIRAPSVPWSSASPAGDRAADLGSLEGFATIFVESRRGFIRSGGATNIAREVRSTSFEDVIADLSVGVAAMVVPMSILNALSVIDVRGGRGFMAVMDLDTVFLTVSIAAVVALLMAWRVHARVDWASLTFVVVLAIVCGLLLAYVVTNFGTMFRLRLLATTPLWTAPLALMTRPSPLP